MGLMPSLAIVASTARESDAISLARAAGLEPPANSLRKSRLSLRERRHLFSGSGLMPGPLSGPLNLEPRLVDEALRLLVEHAPAVAVGRMDIDRLGVDQVLRLWGRL
jgi:hypothetical protein